MIDTQALRSDELDDVFKKKYCSSGGPLGITPSIYQRFDYHSPDDHYEALVARFVRPGCTWLDVGCGRAIFPSNSQLANELARRCKVLVGVDPDPTIAENPIVHEAVQESIYEYRTDLKFDVVTLRMVAEHVGSPRALLHSIARCTERGSVVVIYTVNAWSPVPLLTRLTPFRLRHPIKKLLWQTEEKDTFPTEYRMNTRRTLRRLFAENGFEEVFFANLDDCRTLSRFQHLLKLELALWSALRKFSLRYPESCLLGAYRRS